jgi:hypothetical protein
MVVEPLPIAGLVIVAVTVQNPELLGAVYEVAAVPVVAPVATVSVVVAGTVAVAQVAPAMGVIVKVTVAPLSAATALETDTLIGSAVPRASLLVVGVTVTTGVRPACVTVIVDVAAESASSIVMTQVGDTVVPVAGVAAV